MGHNLHEVTSKIVQEAGLELRRPNSQTSAGSSLPQFQAGLTPEHNHCLLKAPLGPLAVPAWSILQRRVVRPCSAPRAERSLTD